LVSLWTVGCTVSNCRRVGCVVRTSSRLSAVSSTSGRPRALPESARAERQGQSGAFWSSNARPSSTVSPGEEIRHLMSVERGNYDGGRIKPETRGTPQQLIGPRMLHSTIAQLGVYRWIILKMEPQCLPRIHQTAACYHSTKSTCYPPVHPSRSEMAA
jgi:hypothetical protein